MQTLTGQTDADYTVRQAAYDLRKLRGKTSSSNLAGPAATTCRRTRLAIAGLTVLRDHVLAPILADIRTPW